MHLLLCNWGKSSIPARSSVDPEILKLSIVWYISTAYAMQYSGCLGVVYC